MDHISFQNVFLCIISGRTIITFTRPASSNDQAGLDADFSQKCYHLILPDKGGPLSGNQPGYHVGPTYRTPAVSDQKICISSCSGL